MLHRTIYGSLERFIGILIEHYAGALPVWLSPEQIWTIPISAKHKKYADDVNKQLSGLGLQSRLKDENETIGKKIREGEMQKIPYILIIGDKEISAETIRVRKRGKGDIGAMKLSEFTEKIKKEIQLRNA